MGDVHASDKTSIPKLVSIDPFQSAIGQKGLHNRWHPDIPPIATVREGDAFQADCHEWTGGQIHNDDSANDVRDVDLTQIHYLTGPFRVEGAKPGDVLVVDILDVRPFPEMNWGFTGIFDKNNGGGLFATDFNSKAAKAIWDFEGVYATSRHVPGVRFAGVSHPGLIGTAPSPDLLDKWNARERGLIEKRKAANGGTEVVPPVALPPNAKGAYVGQDGLDDGTRKTIYENGCRTIPGREHGGNCDIKNLSRGSRCYFPVFVDGANLSFGDLHFSQGDGEMSLCGAIEMAGTLTVKIHSIIQGGVDKFAMRMPMFLPSPVDPQYARQLVFEGIGVDLHGDGTQGDMDATMAYKTAARNCIDYLVKLGYTQEQAYLLLSAAPVDSHVGAIVDYPNACVTLGLPTAIFDADITPSNGPLPVANFSDCARTS